MRLRSSDKERYIGLFWISAQLDIKQRLMYYYAVKHRLRFFKFAGNRYLELEDAKRLIRFFAIKLDTDFDEILDQLN